MDRQHPDAAASGDAGGRGRRVSWELAAGAASSMVGILAALVAMPLYLRFLGPERFGVLGFFMALQGAVLALDAGVSISLTRRVAQADAPGQRQAVAQLVRGLSRAAWAIALALAIALAAAAPLLANHWLRLDRLPLAHAQQALAIAALAIALRWPIAMYNGVLIGARRIVAMAGLNVGFAVLVTAAAVAAAAWTADLRAVIGCLAMGAMLHLAASARLALRSVGPASPAPAPVLVDFMRQAAAAGWMGVIGLLLLQQDKLVLSRLLPVADFGYYMMASLAATSLYALVTPVFNIAYPRLAREAAGDARKLEALYRGASLFLASLLFPLAAALGLFGGSVLQAWTGDAAAARAGGPLVLLLAAATALHGTMFIPYALKLALGESRLALHISVALFVLSLPVIGIGAWRWGAAGAAGGWLALQATYVLAGSALTHARLLPAVGSRWLLADVAPPLAVSLAAVGLAAFVAERAFVQAQARVAVAAFSVVACWAVLWLANARLRDAARSFLVHTD